MISVELCKRAVCSRGPTQIHGNRGCGCVSAEKPATPWKNSMLQLCPAIPSPRWPFVNSLALNFNFDPFVVIRSEAESTSRLIKQREVHLPPFHVLLIRIRKINRESPLRILGNALISHFRIFCTLSQPHGNHPTNITYSRRS